MILLSWLIRWLQWRFPFLFDGQRCADSVRYAVAEEADRLEHDVRQWAEQKLDLIYPHPPASVRDIEVRMKWMVDAHGNKVQMLVGPEGKPLNFDTYQVRAVKVEQDDRMPRWTTGGP